MEEVITETPEKPKVKAIYSAEYRKKYYLEHKAEIAEKARVYRRNNLDKYREYQRRWYNKNRMKLLKAQENEGIIAEMVALKQKVQAVLEKVNVQNVQQVH